MLELVNLSKSYGGRTVLAALSHRFEPGEFVAIMGESGVGKSTLLNLIAGLDAPDAGEVKVDGTPMSALDDDAATRLRRARMGFIFQAFHVLPHLTLEQNVALPLLLNGNPDRVRAAPIFRASCRAESCSGWPSRAPSCTAPPCCWRTSRRATSTRKRPTASCTCCARRSRRAARAPSWSRTRTRRPPWPTGRSC